VSNTARAKLAVPLVRVNGAWRFVVILWILGEVFGGWFVQVVMVYS